MHGGVYQLKHHSNATRDNRMQYDVFAFWMAQPASTAKWSTADLSKARVLLLNESEQHAT